MAQNVKDDDHDSITPLSPTPTLTPSTSSERNSHRRSPYTLGHHLPTDRELLNNVRMLNDNDTLQHDSKVGRA